MWQLYPGQTRSANCCWIALTIIEWFDASDPLTYITGLGVTKAFGGKWAWISAWMSSLKLMWAGYSRVGSGRRAEGLEARLHVVNVSPVHCKSHPQVCKTPTPFPLKGSVDRTLQITICNTCLPLQSFYTIICKFSLAAIDAMYSTECSCTWCDGVLTNLVLREC